MGTWKERIRAEELKQQQRQEVEQGRINAEREASERAAKARQGEASRTTQDAMEILDELGVKKMLEKIRREWWGEEGTTIVPFFDKFERDEVTGRPLRTKEDYGKYGTRPAKNVTRNGLQIVYSYRQPKEERVDIYKRKFGKFYTFDDGYSTQGSGTWVPGDSHKYFGWHDEVVGYNVSCSWSERSITSGVYVEDSYSYGYFDQAELLVATFGMEDNLYIDMADIRGSGSSIEKKFYEDARQKGLEGRLPKEIRLRTQKELSGIQEAMRRNPHKT